MCPGIHFTSQTFQARRVNPKAASTAKCAMRLECVRITCRVPSGCGARPTGTDPEGSPMDAKRLLVALSVAAVCCAPLAGCAAGNDGSEDSGGGSFSSGASESDGSGSGGSSVSDAVDDALSEAGRALDDARDSMGAALSSVGAAMDLAFEEATAALDEAMADISTNLRESLGTVEAELSRTTELAVEDAQTGAAVATVTDETAISDVFSGLDYTSWRLADATPAAGDARYTLRCMQSSVGLLNSGELYEMLTITTYDGGYLELSVFGWSGSVVFEVPQADVDALNALAG